MKKRRREKAPPPSRELPAIGNSLRLIERYGGIDGAHHKQWVIDQVARVLTGTSYRKWVKAMTSGDNEGYEWDTGVAP